MINYILKHYQNHLESFRSDLKKIICIFKILPDNLLISIYHFKNYYFHLW